jgi:hypothetical protein
MHIQAWIAQGKCASQHWSRAGRQCIVRLEMSVVPTFRVLATSCWLAPLLLAGCLGGQTGTEEWVDRGGEGPGSPTNGEGSGCEDEEQDVASDDASLGFAFDDVAAFVIGEHSTDLAWGNATSSVSFGPESGIGSLALGIDWTGGVKRIHSVPRYDDSGAEGPAIGILCPPDRLAAHRRRERGPRGARSRHPDRPGTGRFPGHARTGLHHACRGHPRRIHRGRLRR